MLGITALLAGAGALAGASIGTEKASEGPDYEIRKIHEFEERWLVTELLNYVTLRDVGRLFDVGIDSWVDDLASGNSRVLVLAQIGAPLRQQMLIKVALDEGGWDLDEAYHPQMQRVSKDAHLQRIGELLYILDHSRAS